MSKARPEKRSAKRKYEQPILTMDERHGNIVDFLKKEAKIKVEELADRLRVSQVTIRKDLDALERRGLLQRSHGNAIFSQQSRFNVAFLEKLHRGPKVLMTVMPNGPAGMGGSLAGWALFILVVTFIGAHVASSILAPGASSHAIFHTVGLFTLAAYSFALWPLSIWYGRGWGISIKSTVDGLIYAIATGLIFMWLWPH